MTTKAKETQVDDQCKAVVGQPAPDFDLPMSPSGNMKLSDLKGKKVILYFYPKDNTSGCTLEALAFERELKRFEDAGYVVIGVSRDSVRSHELFKQKQSLSFPLLSDEAETACREYGVLKMKSMYGRTYLGIVRSTFVIDENGILTHEFRNVKAKTHVDDLVKKLLPAEEAK